MIIFLSISLIMCFVKTVLFSTYNICLGWKIRKKNSYTLLSGGLFKVIFSNNKTQFASDLHMWQMILSLQNLLSQRFVCLIWIFMPQSTILQLRWTEPVLSKDKCVLLKDTTQWRWWGSKPWPLVLESNTLPLSYCSPFIDGGETVNICCTLT